MRHAGLPLLPPAAVLSAAPSRGRPIWRVYPSEVTLSGKDRTQQLLVVEEENGRTVRDVTSTAKFTVPNGKGGPVVKVDANGLVTGIDGGDFKIAVTVGGKSVEVTGSVGSVKPDDVSFRNHVIPTLTRAGCNAGSCHGALAGKGGMKLSLRGFDPETDWFVLTPEHLRTARRSHEADRQPHTLKKATRTIPHGGGTRFIEDSPHYKVVFDWIRTGAPGPKADDATLEQLEVFPPAILVNPKDAKNTFRAVVRAVYSDGTTEDVTRWARVRIERRTRRARQWRTALSHPRATAKPRSPSASGTKVATLTVTAPFPTTVPAEADSTKSPR